MGSASSTTQVSGYLHIEMETRNFQAGQTIQGTIHVYLTKAIQTNGLFLLFKGEDIGMWNAYRSGYQYLNNPRYVSHETMGQAPIINKRFPITSFPSGIAGPGQFSHPFSLKLPSNLPGSFHLEYGNVYARITYTVSALIDSSKSDVEPQTVYVQVDQLLPRQIEAMIETQEFPVVAGCWSRMGVVGIMVGFVKNAVVPGERLDLLVQVDNSHCSQSLRGIEATLYRTVRVTGPTGETFTEKESLRIISFIERIPPGAALLGESCAHIPITIDDYNSDIQDAVSVKSRFIECVYSVGVKALFDKGCCGDDIGEAEKQVVVYSRQLQPIGPRLLPEQWNPMLMPAVSLEAGGESYNQPAVSIDHLIRPIII